MGLETNTEVERLTSVLDSNGNNVSPPNETLQQQIQATLDAIEGELVDIEADQETANGTLSNLDSKQATTNSKLDTVESSLGAIEGDQQATKSAVNGVQSRLGNWSNLHTDTFTDGGGGSSPNAKSVPDGVSVIVQASNENSAYVSVGPSGSEHLELVAGQAITVQVDNLSDISAKASSGTQRVNILMEDN